jgi:hypothetical protein
VVIGKARGAVMRSGILLPLNPQEDLRIPCDVLPSHSAVLRLVVDDELPQVDRPIPSTEADTLEPSRCRPSLAFSSVNLLPVRSWHAWGKARATPDSSEGR